MLADVFEDLIHCVRASDIGRHLVLVLTREDRALVSTIAYVILQQLDAYPTVMVTVRRINVV